MVALSVFVVIPTHIFSVVLDWRNTGVILGAALVFSVVYWYVARIGARRRLLRAMHCRSLDPHDRYHQRLANIAEEMRLASGAPRVECVTVSTLGMNAFAFSDLKGAGVIGVTEGALARLSRPQLQAVVAHEFAHILSGTYVTATVSCLLFGVYSELGDRLEAAASGDEDNLWALFGLTAGMLRLLLFVVQFASRVTSSALSRSRELEADVAAARYTRDPLSLAEALRMMGRHPGGAGYIPEGLAPLCIRTTEGAYAWLLGRWQATHPPLELSRCAAAVPGARVAGGVLPAERGGGRSVRPARARGALAGGRRRARRSARGAGHAARSGRRSGTRAPAELAGAPHDLPELRRRARSGRLRGHPAAGVPHVRRPSGLD